ncbi:high choriolytic enzyme 1-like [Engraulis encrasicolus]|uniref:high choriolytic enzyme 1-like n=1 Tax=Engraulis encrasicolus TaxID=184585 RepID=UPI002FD09648
MGEGIQRTEQELHGMVQKHQNHLQINTGKTKELVVDFHRSTTAAEAKKRNKLVKKAGSVRGCNLDAVEVVGDRRRMTKLSSILANINHPLHGTVAALRSDGDDGHQLLHYGLSVHPGPVLAPSTAILLLCLLGILMPVHCQDEDSLDDDSLDDDSLEDKMTKTVSDLIEEANKNLGQEPGDPEIVDGDVVVSTGLQNADPCTARKCKWPSSSNGLVYIPYVLSSRYSVRAKRYIKRAMQSFTNSTCVRFRRRRRERDYLYIQSRKGCWSKLGRRGRKQVISLGKGCVYRKTIQHELLHALGFNHEQKRSDRDLHIKVLWNNVRKGKKHNFRKVATNNLGTPYDYGSIMHYSKKAFSRNGKPTLVAIPNPNVVFGRAKKMSRQDIRRVNLLYGCK